MGGWLRLLGALVMVSPAISTRVCKAKPFRLCINSLKKDGCEIQQVISICLSNRAGVGAVVTILSYTRRKFTQAFGKVPVIKKPR